MSKLNDVWLTLFALSHYLDNLKTTSWLCFLRRLWRSKAKKAKEFCKRNLNIELLNYVSIKLIECVRVRRGIADGCCLLSLSVEFKRLIYGVRSHYKMIEQCYDYILL